MQKVEIHIKQALSSNVPQAFELIYKHYFADLCVYALRFFDNKDDAQDLVQQTIIKLWEQQDKLQNAEYLHTYLYRCVHHAGLNSVRNNKLKAHSQSDEILQDLHWEFTDELISQEQCNEIEIAIKELPSQCRTVLELNRMQGLSYKQIAEKLSISHRTVDSHLTNATRILRQKLKGIGPSGIFASVFILIIIK